MTNVRFALGACIGLALGFASLLAGTATAQQASVKDQLVGTWILVSVVNEAADGSKTEGFGPNPKGAMIFASDGHFSLFQSRAEIPRIAASDRSKATPEEATAIVASTIAYYGSYSVNEGDKTIMVKVAASTFANVAGGPEQKRVVTLLTADELRFVNPRTPSGVTLHTVWKRAKAP